jgi:hypothetical protein
MLDSTPVNGHESLRKKRTYAKAADIIVAHKLLGELLEQMDIGKFKYKNGMTDERVAAQLNLPSLNVDAIAKLRRQLFGDLGALSVRGKKSKLEERLQAIEQRLEALEKLWS